MLSHAFLLFQCCRMIQTTGPLENSQHQHEAYVDTNIGWVDAKVASLLCKGGLIAYVLNPLSEVTNQWVLDHVVPN